MMQSILSTTLSKQVSSKESLSESTKLQESVEGEALPLEENLATNFSELLDSALIEINEIEVDELELPIAETEELDFSEVDSEGEYLLVADSEELDLSEVDSEGEYLLATNSEELDLSEVDSEGEYLLATNSEELDLSEVDAEKSDINVIDMKADQLGIQSELQQSSDKRSIVDIPQTEVVDALQEKKVENITITSTDSIYKQASQEKSVQYSQSEHLNEESLINKKSEHQPILAQIESAQKVDTQIIETEQKMMVSVEGGTLLSAVKKSEEKSLLVTDTFFKEGEDENLKSEFKLPVADKTANVLLTTKNETTELLSNNSINNSVTNNGALVFNSNSSLDKSVNMNIQNSSQLMQLQQPLELQAKNGSVQIGERVLMMINQDKQEVSIRLDPAELGSINIKLQIQQDQVQLTIQTQASLSRDIIEQNLPRLREQLNQQGINLGEASVEQQGDQQKQQQQEKNSVHNTTDSVQNEPFHSDISDQNEWFGSKILLPAQGIDYYA